jgi:hypothetical protein
LPPALIGTTDALALCYRLEIEKHTSGGYAVKRQLSRVAYQLTPPILWNAYLRARSLKQRNTEHQFDNVRTVADPTPVLNGRFGAIHDRYYSINPNYTTSTRYRLQHYVACWFAMLARPVPGDYVIAGVSHGVSAKVIYEYVDLPNLGKTMHLVDPFDGKTVRGAIAASYNTDPERVLRLFERGFVKLHRQPAPIELGSLAFVYGDTGDVESDAAALPSFYEQLNPGGIWVSNYYGTETGAYREALNRLHVEPLWLPNGQGVIIKA